MTQHPARVEPLPRWYRLAAIVAALMAMGLINIAYTHWVDGKRQRAERVALAAVAAQEREADRRWCGLLSTLDKAYRETPPTTPTGINVAAAVHMLYLNLGCNRK